MILFHSDSRGRADEWSIHATDSDVAASPITVVFQRAGFGAAVHLVNAVLLTAVLSATNSCFFASSRMLLSLARSGQAPRIFGWVNRRGVPVPALVMALLVSFLTRPDGVDEGDLSSLSACFSSLLSSTFTFVSFSLISVLGGLDREVTAV